MKFGDLLNKLAAKSGIPAADKQLMDVLSKAEIATMEIPDDLANNLDRSLMDVNAAKSHPDVIKKIKAETLNGADSLLQKLAGELEVEGADDLLKDTNTFAKIESIMKAIKTAGDKKIAAASGTDKAAYQKQIEDLNRKLTETISTHKTEADKLKSEYADKVHGLTMKSMLANKKYSLPAEMDADMKADIAYNALKVELSKKGLKIDNSTGSPVLLKADGTDYYNEAHVKVGLTEFIDGVLAQNKLLAVTDPLPPVLPPVTPPSPNEPSKVNMDAVAMIDQQLANVGIGTKTT